MSNPFESLSNAIDKAWENTDVEETTEPTELDAEEESTDELDQDTSDELDAETQDQDDDTEEDDAAGDPADQDEDETDEEDTEETSDEEPTESTEDTFFDRKEIEAITDPAAKAVAQKAYKAMQSAFTKKTQEVAQVRREAEGMKAEFDAFVAELSTEEGVQDLVLKIALTQPDIFDAAYERYQELTEDPKERLSFDREQKLKAREKEIRLREEMERRQVQEHQAAMIRETTKKAASQNGLAPHELEIAEHYVANRLLLNKQNGKDGVSREEIEAAVKLAATHLGASKKQVEKQVGREQRMKQADAVKAKAKAAKRPAPPKSNQAPGARRRPAPPAGVDTLSWAIKQNMGVL